MSWLQWFTSVPILIPTGSVRGLNDVLTHWGRVTHFMHQQTRLSLLQTVACHMFSAKPLSEPVLELLIGPLGTNLSEISNEIHTFSFKKCIWKCHLEDGGHFVLASMCYCKTAVCIVCLQWRYQSLYECIIIYLLALRKLSMFIGIIMMSSSENIFRITGLLWLVNSPHKGQWCGALMFSSICTLNKQISKQ